MAKQIINIGSGQNEGDGGPIRLAFEKINSNFDELYSGTVQTLTLVGTTLSISGGNQVTFDNVFEGGLTADVTGSVFGDDSTLLVDSVNNIIVGNVVSGIVSADFLGGSNLQIDGSSVLNGTVSVTGGITGDLTGSVFADDSSLLVDAVNGSIPYPVHAGVVWDGLRPETVADALDRLADYTQNFAVSTPADWSGTAPTSIIEAIDRLATVVKALNSGVGA